MIQYSLKITSIYCCIFVLNWVAFIRLLYLGVIVSVLLLGSEVGVIEGLSQVTSLFNEIKALSNYYGYKGQILNSSLIMSIIPVALYANANLIQSAGVYMLLNRVNSKYYIGSSVNLARRLKQHILGHSSNNHLQNAFNKYGLQSF